MIVARPIIIGVLGFCVAAATALAQAPGVPIPVAEASGGFGSLFVSGGTIGVLVWLVIEERKERQAARQALIMLMESSSEGRARIEQEIRMILVDCVSRNNDAMKGHSEAYAACARALSDLARVLDRFDYHDKNDRR